MANELQTVAQGDALTVYAVIRKTADATVWQTTTSTFVAWADADIANYDVALTNVGGDLYAGNFPTAIAAGTNVRVSYYQRAGATPAITDLLLGSREYSWSGTALSSVAGTVAAVGCQLTDLATVKRYLEITVATYDDLLQQLINQQSARVIRLIGRALCAADYTEFYRVERDACLTLRQHPVIHVARVAYGSADVIDVSYTGSGVRALVSVTDTGVRLTSTSAAGTTTSTVLSFATYPTLSTMATAINAVADWDASLTDPAVDGLSSNLNRLSSVSVKTGRSSREVGLTWPDSEADGYELDHASGIVRLRGGCGRHNRLAWAYGCDDEWWDRPGCSSVLVEYRAGYETIPQDIAQVVTELAASAYARSGDSATTGAVSSESLGDYSVSYSQNTESSIADQVRLTGDQVSLLSPYMTARVGSGC